jgi:hypothetical protein
LLLLLLQECLLLAHGGVHVRVELTLHLLLLLLLLEHLLLSRSQMLHRVRIWIRAWWHAAHHGRVDLSAWS